MNLSEWAERGDCIGASPSFPNGYQILADDTDRQVIGIAQQLSRKYKLFPKFFLLGHSGGGQFVHRFVLAHPELVLGCVATSSGTWAEALNPAAAHIPIAIGCGEADNQKTSPEAPYTRIEWAHRFEHLLMQGDYFYTAHFWKGAGHGGNARDIHQMELDTFALGSCGMFEQPRREIDGKLADADAGITAEDYGKSVADVTSVMEQAKSLTSIEVSKSLAAANWHANRVVPENCVKLARGYVSFRTTPLLARLQTAGLARVAALQKQGDADAVEKLGKLKQDFEGIARVKQAADAALRRLGQK